MYVKKNKTRNVISALLLSSEMACTHFCCLTSDRNGEDPPLPQFVHNQMPQMSISSLTVNKEGVDLINMLNF